MIDLTIVNPPEEVEPFIEEEPEVCKNCGQFAFYDCPCPGCLLKDTTSGYY